MSNEALNWAWRSGVDPGPRFVLVALGDQGQDHSGEDWTCFPSINRLVERTGFSRATIERHLKWLAADGWIRRARRRRADGTLGIYDFTLVRDRPALGLPGSVASAAKSLKSLGDEPGDPLAEADEPHVNLQHGETCEPHVNLRDTTRQFEGQPYVNLRAQEPLLEPLPEPTLKAREPGDDGFEEGFAAYEPRGQARTDQPLARAAWAMQRQAIGRDALIACVRRYVAQDADLARGDYGASAFERWLAGEKWRVWDRPAEAAPPQALTFPDAGIRAALVGWFDEPFARSYLDRCAWDAEARVITPATRRAHERLTDDQARRFFAPLNVTIAPHNGPQP